VPPTTRPNSAGPAPTLGSGSRTPLKVRP
jgi:hypothetical protein